MIVSSAAAFLLAAPVTPTQEREQLGNGTFAGLHPEQQRLFAELIGRFSGLVGRELQPEQVCLRMPESLRTTFEAVTHALLRTDLTSESGHRIGTALDPVDYVDKILGQSPGQRGDRQFLLYVFLKPDAADKLDRSREFIRKGETRFTIWVSR